MTKSWWKYSVLYYIIIGWGEINEYDNIILLYACSVVLYTYICAYNVFVYRYTLKLVTTSVFAIAVRINYIYIFFCIINRVHTHDRNTYND